MLEKQPQLCSANAVEGFRMRAGGGAAAEQQESKKRDECMGRALSGL